MSDYSAYADNVVYTAPISGWMRPLARKLVRKLWHEDIIVDYIWFALVHNASYMEMRAICSDEDDEMVECIALWEHNVADVVTPQDQPWELVEVEICDVPEGLV